MVSILTTNAVGVGRLALTDGSSVARPRTLSRVNGVHQGALALRSAPLFSCTRNALKRKRILDIFRRFSLVQGRPLSPGDAAEGGRVMFQCRNVTGCN